MLNAYWDERQMQFFGKIVRLTSVNSEDRRADFQKQKQNFLDEMMETNL